MTWTIRRCNYRLFIFRDTTLLLVMGRPVMRSAGWIIFIGGDSVSCNTPGELMKALRRKLEKVS